MSPNIVKVHEAVCAAFPDITTYGTFRGDGEHSQGLAVDIMVSGARGYEVRDFVRAHYAELGVNYIIYSQHIWSVDRSGEGWRAHVRPRLDHREPLRPRPRHDVLTRAGRAVVPAPR